MTAPAPGDTNRLWSFRDLAKRWHVTTDQLRHWKARGRIQTIKIGSWNWVPDHVVRAIEMQHSNSTGPGTT